MHTYIHAYIHVARTSLSISTCGLIGLYVCMCMCTKVACACACACVCMYLHLWPHQLGRHTEAGGGGHIRLEVYMCMYIRLEVYQDLGHIGNLFANLALDLDRDLPRMCASRICMHAHACMDGCMHMHAWVRELRARP